MPLTPASNLANAPESAERTLLLDPPVDMAVSTTEAARPSTGAASPLHRLACSLLASDGRYAHGFENFILGLILFSVASVAVEPLPGLPLWAHRLLYVGELIVVAVFSAEYVLRVVTAERKWSFMLSFAGVVDLLSVAPFYLSGLDLRWVRVLRLLRLVRVLKLQTHVLEATVADRTRELAEKNLALQKAHAHIDAELEVARALQTAILPASFPSRHGCDGAACMIPATTMGGDFYDFIALPDGCIGLVVADVSGKGVPAAFFMAVARTNLRDRAGDHALPGRCLAQTNDALCTQNPMDLFVTAFYCILNPASGLLRYANAGHDPPCLQRADGSARLLDGAGGVMLGVLPGAAYPDHTLQLLPGDRLLLYTDGITEAFNVDGEAFGLKRLTAELRAGSGGSACGLVEHICGSVKAFAGDAAQSDDITLIALSWDGTAMPSMQP